MTAENQIELFSGDQGLIFQGRFQCMPGEAGALHTHGKLTHTGKDLQTSKIDSARSLRQARRSPSCETRRRALSASACVLPLTATVIMLAAALEMAQPEPSKLTSASRAVVQRRVDGELIAAERVVPFGSMIGRFQFMEVTRFLVVVEDDLLVKLA